MPQEPTGVQPIQARWAIALDWFPLHHRSAWVLLKDHLCPVCAKRLSSKKEPLLETVFTSIERCCSHSPDFITYKLPILESAFRLFLRNGNRPMTLQELSSEPGQVRLGDVYRSSPEALLRILKNDCFYGLQQIPG